MKKRYSQQDFELACSDLQMIFNRDPAMPLRSASECFDGRTISKKDKKNRPQLKRCSNKETLQVSASETRRSQKSPPIPIEQSYSGIPMARISRLGPEAITILKAIYLPASSHQYEYQIKANVLTQRRYFDSLDTPLRSKMRQLLPRMVDLKLESLRTPTLAVAITIKTWEYFDLNPDNWHQHYSKRWRGICGLIDEIHEEAAMSFYYGRCA